MRNKVYYTGHGSYATAFNELDISLLADNTTGTKCGTQPSQDYDTRYADNLCVSLTKVPEDAIRINIPKGWRYWSSGYYYILKPYPAPGCNLKPGSYCYGKTETQHCKGLIYAGENALGAFYYLTEP